MDNECKCLSVPEVYQHAKEEKEWNNGLFIACAVGFVVFTCVTVILRCCCKGFTFFVKGGRRNREALEAGAAVGQDGQVGRTSGGAAEEQEGEREPFRWRNFLALWGCTLIAFHCLPGAVYFFIVASGIDPETEHENYWFGCGDNRFAPPPPAML